MVVEQNATTYLVTYMKKMENSLSVVCLDGDDSFAALCSYPVSFMLPLCHCTSCCLRLGRNSSLSAELVDIISLLFSAGLGYENGKVRFRSVGDNI